MSEVGVGSGPTTTTTVDLGDMLIAPGFVDVHVHGGGGAQVNCATREEVEESVGRMARFHATHGTTALLATTVSDSPEALRAAVEGVAAVASAPPGGSGPEFEAGAGRARLPPGRPLDRPFESGGQFVPALRPPSRRPSLTTSWPAANGTVRLVTIAPELEGALELITAARICRRRRLDRSHRRRLCDDEAAPSMPERATPRTFSTQWRRSTTAGRARSLQLSETSVSRSRSSLTASTYTPRSIALVATLAPERLVLVTDAIGATGAAPGLHRLGPLEVFVTDGRAVLAGNAETVAGSVLTMDRAVALAVDVARVPLLTALQAASLHPARVLGEHRKGRLIPGADADLVVLDRRLESRRDRHRRPGRLRPDRLAQFPRRPNSAQFGRSDGAGANAVTAVLGLDVGGTHSRARLVRDGAVVAEANGPSASLAAAGRDRAGVAVRSLLGELALGLARSSTQCASVPPGLGLPSPTPSSSNCCPPSPGEDGSWSSMTLGSCSRPAVSPRGSPA